MARMAIHVSYSVKKHGASLADEIAKWLFRFSGDHHLTLGSSLRTSPPPGSALSSLL